MSWLFLIVGGGGGWRAGGAFLICLHGALGLICAPEYLLQRRLPRSQPGRGGRHSLKCSPWRLNN